MQRLVTGQPFSTLLGAWRLLAVALVSVVLCGFALPGARGAFAQGLPSHRIEVEGSGQPITVTGTIGVHEPFVGSIRVTPRGGDLSTFSFLPTALQREGSGDQLGAEAVTVSGDTPLTADVPRLMQLKISGLQRTGTYHGQFRIVAPGATSEPIELRVVARAQQVVPDGDRVEIRGWVGDESSFRGTVRLLAVGGEAKDLVFLASPVLPQQAGGEIIDPASVVIGPDHGITANTAKNFQIGITGIKQPGTYLGTLRVLAPGQNVDEARSVALTVVARARPNITAVAGTDPATPLRLVRCADGLDCGLARWLFPAGAFRRSIELHFENASGADVSITETAVLVRGELSGYQPARDSLYVAQESSGQLAPLQLPHAASGRVFGMNVAIDPTRMPADHYVGKVYLTATGRDGPISVPLDLSMREGPLGPLAAIFAGILLGRLVKYMNDRGNAEGDALLAAIRAERSSDRAHPDDQAVLRRQLESARQTIYSGRPATAIDELNAIAGRQELLAALRRLEDLVRGNTDLERQIAEARFWIDSKSDAKARDVVQELQTAVSRLPPSGLDEFRGGFGPGAVPDVAGALRAASDVLDRANDAVRAAAGGVGTGFDRARSWLQNLVGDTGRLRAEAALWLARPLLYALLLVLLAYTGLSTLYVANGNTFGANAFADYMLLFTWGLTSDVASRTLANLAGTATK